MDFLYLCFGDQAEEFVDVMYEILVKKLPLKIVIEADNHESWRIFDRVMRSIKNVLSVKADYRPNDHLCAHLVQNPIDIKFDELCNSSYSYIIPWLRDMPALEETCSLTSLDRFVSFKLAQLDISAARFIDTQKLEELFFHYTPRSKRRKLH